MPTSPPRPGLTVDRIVRAGLEIVDAEGIKALTMRRVAGALGVEAMSLYHHVPNKDALLDGILDLLIADAELPRDAADVGTWIAGAAAAFRRLGRTHPRAYGLLLNRVLPLGTDDAALPIEQGMALFADQGRTPAQAFAAVQAVSISMLAMGLVEVADALADPTAPEPRGGYDLPADRFPLLTAITSASVDLDEYWNALVGALARGMG